MWLLVLGWRHVPQARRVLPGYDGLDAGHDSSAPLSQALNGWLHHRALCVVRVSFFLFVKCFYSLLKDMQRREARSSQIALLALFVRNVSLLAGGGCAEPISCQTHLQTAGCMLRGQMK